ncbi:MAG: DNA polymerase III subunit beta [Chloroflexi bacterium UTCFX4]|jgi:DNA polymerase-3 subunit beta|nr:MAG: DNA polymerase III subunit beta [Chloroflexi bacterium UTCFX4]
MKVSVSQENLARGIAIVSRAVATRSTLPVLSHILLATEGGRLKLAATNLEIGITHWIPAQVKTEGAITVPARQIADYVNALPPDTVEMELNSKTQTLHLKCARYDANIKGVDASEFPIIPVISDGVNQKIFIESDALKNIIAQTTFSAAQDDSRPVLTGVLAKFDKDTVTFASADGFRLSVRSALLGSKLDAPISVIIPAKTLTDVSRIMGDQDAPVEIAITENRSQVMFHLANTDLVSQLIDGNFPDFNQIIPKTRTTRTVMNTNELQNAVKAASVFARESSNTVRLNISSGNDMGGGRVVITAQSAETGDNVGEIDATVEGDPIEIAFNARFLADVLVVLNSPQMALETLGAASPGVIKPVGRDDFTHVIMPMHIGK